jgi:folate-dependent tRNA-U54 methylase TrmFO/GidA
MPNHRHESRLHGRALGQRHRRLHQLPHDREEYDRFLDALLAAEAAEAKEWEKLDYFEGCLPIEVLARRGRDTCASAP